MVSHVSARVQLLALVIAVACHQLDAKCLICDDGVLQPNAVAGDDGGQSYTCSVAEDWLNSGQTDTSCADAQIFFGSKCCKETSTNDQLDAKCLICKDGALQANAVAGEESGQPYTCSSSETWLNSGQTDMSCADGQAFWGGKCCEESKDQLDAKCLICPDGALQANAVAGEESGQPYTCSSSETWLNSGQTDMSCTDGQALWGGKCCKKLSMKVIENTCCGQAEQYLSDPEVWKDEPLGVAIGNAQGPCCVIDAGISPSESIDIFSASKMVTGYIILRLVDKGLLTLHARVSDYLDWWTKDDSDKRSKVSIKHLLSQVDGLGTFKAGLGQCSAKTTIECAKVAYNSSHRHSPETTFVYTETSFAVLGAVAMHVTNSPDYEAVFRKVMADELDIDASACSWTATWSVWTDPGASLRCSMHEYMKLIRAFQNGFVSTELSNEAENAQTHLYNVSATNGESTFPVFGRELHYGLGQWRECYTTDCHGDKGVWTQSLGLLGYYPWKWRNGDAAYWGILARYAYKDVGNFAALEMRSFKIAHDLHDNIPVEKISASAPAPPPPGPQSPSDTDSGDFDASSRTSAPDSASGTTTALVATISFDDPLKFDLNAYKDAAKKHTGASAVEAVLSSLEIVVKYALPASASISLSNIKAAIAKVNSVLESQISLETSESRRLNTHRLLAASDTIFDVTIAVPDADTATAAKVKETASDVKGLESELGVTVSVSKEPVAVAKVATTLTSDPSTSSTLESKLVEVGSEIGGTVEVAAVTTPQDEIEASSTILPGAPALLILLMVASLIGLI